MQTLKVKPDLMCLNIMLDLYGKQGFIKQAVQIFDSLKDYDLKPDTVTFTIMIDMFCKSGNIDVSYHKANIIQFRLLKKYLNKW